MNIKKLKEEIADLSDDALIIAPSGDHSFRVVQACAATALYDAKLRCWSEDHGEEITPEAEYGKRIDVLIIE